MPSFMLLIATLIAACSSTQASPLVPGSTYFKWLDVDARGTVKCSHGAVPQRLVIQIWEYDIGPWADDQAYEDMSMTDRAKARIWEDGRFSIHGMVTDIAGEKPEPYLYITGYCGFTQYKESYGIPCDSQYRVKPGECGGHPPLPCRYVKLDGVTITLDGKNDRPIQKWC